LRGEGHGPAAEPVRERLNDSGCLTRQGSGDRDDPGRARLAVVNEQGHEGQPAIRINA